MQDPPPGSAPLAIVARNDLALAEALEDSIPAVRAAAARSLGLFRARASGSLPALERALDDPAPEVREAVTEALGRIRASTKNAAEK